MATTKKVYDNPALRERIKAKITAGDKGGRPGQWSARKAQLVAHEYEAAGGGYLGPPADGQKHLHEWTQEQWTTADDKPAIRGKATTHRYLPKKVWDQLSPAEKKATDQKKVDGSKSGKQFVANTPAAKRARKATVRSATKSVGVKSTTAKVPARARRTRSAANV